MAAINKIIFVTFLFLEILSVTLASCVPRNDISMGEKIYYAPHVVVGTVEEIIPLDPKYKSNEPNAHGAKFTVKCIYKGGSISEDITIVGAGQVKEKCHSTNITAGNMYIMYLKHENENEKWFEPMYSENDGSETYMDEITFECYMHPIAPIEKGESKTECPHSEDVPGDLCDVWTPTTTQEPVTQPEPTTKAAEKGGQAAGDGGGAEKNFVSFALVLFCVISRMLML